MVVPYSIVHYYSSPPPQRCAAYVTLNWMITGVEGFTTFLIMGPPGPGPHGNGWIVTDERYVVMPWKMVTMHGKNMTLAEAVDGVFSHQESERKECERRERE